MGGAPRGARRQRRQSLENPVSEIIVTVVDEDGKPVEFARVAFSARVITPRYLDDEGQAAMKVAAVEARVAQLAARTDAKGVARISDRPAPRVFGVLGPLYVLARAGRTQSPTPYVDLILSNGALFLTVDKTGYNRLTYRARPGERVVVPLRRISGPSLRGRVLDSKGRPVWGAALTVHEAEGGPAIATDYSDLQGQFAIAVQRPWRFVVRVTPPEDLRAAGEQAITIPMDTTYEMDVRTVAGPIPAPTIAKREE